VSSDPRWKVLPSRAGEPAKARATSLTSMAPKALLCKALLSALGAVTAASLQPIVLVDNGSKRPASTLALRETAAALSSLLDGREVLPASVGFSDTVAPELLGGVPARKLSDVLADISSRGGDGATIAPLFLGPSGGLTKGVAACAAELPASFDLRVGACLVDDEGAPEDDRIGRELAAQVLHLMDDARLCDPLNVLVVDHGTPSPRVHAVRERLVAEVRAALGSRASSVCGASMERRDDPAYDFNEPLLERALAAPPYDEGDVVLAMAFLLPGRHAGEGGDVAQIVEAAQQAAAAAGDTAKEALRVHPTPLLGGTSHVLNVLADRVRNAEASRIGSPR